MKHCVGRAFFACVAVAMALAAMSAPALAQGTYYQELTIDGRIYVWTSESALKTYQASKELAVGTVTRPGYGPNGETVVFEGPKAIEEYNKRHSKTDAPPKEAKVAAVKLPFDIKYRMPGLRFTFPKFELNWVNRIQLRYTYDDQDVSTPQNNKGSFRVRRFKTKLDGWIYTKDLKYELQMNWVGGPSVSGRNTPNLEDGNLQYDFTGGQKLFMLKGGQYKAPFGRQELTSSGSQQFVDRSIASGFFSPGRQIGLETLGQFGTKNVPDMVTYAGGLFNGNGINRSTNDNDKYEYVGRVMFSPVGNVGYSESNLQHYDFRISVAGDYNNNNQIVIPADGDPTGIDVTSEWGADLVIKELGGLFLYGEYYWRTIDNVAGAATAQTGLTAQLGWLFGIHWEIAGRYSQIDPNTDVDENLQKEYRAGLNWYINKHNLKIQTDFGWLENEAQNGADGEPPRKNKEWRLQAQLIF